MQRRAFIRLSTYGTVMLGVPFIAGCGHKPVNAGIDQPPFLLHIMDKKTILETGKRYISMVPQEGSSSRLESLLTEKMNISGSTPPEKVHDHFNALSTADFKANRTIIVDGWVLSATEARQCALFSLVET